MSAAALDSGSSDEVRVYDQTPDGPVLVPPTTARLGDVRISVTRTTASRAVLAIAYAHPERGPEVVNVPLELGGAVMLAHGLLGAVCAPAPAEETTS